MTYQTRNDPFANQALADALNEAIQKHGGDLFNNCGNCSHMNYPGPPVCKLFNMTPPIQTIMKGCKNYNDAKEIPF